jgi:hypothetical protein
LSDEYVDSYRRFYTGMSLEAFGSLTEPAEVQVLIKYTSNTLRRVITGNSFQVYYGLNDLMSYLKRAKLRSPILERAPRVNLEDIHPWNELICRRQEFITQKRMMDAVHLTWERDEMLQECFLHSIHNFTKLQFLDVCAKGRHFVSGIAPKDFVEAQPIVEQERVNCQCCATHTGFDNAELLNARSK